MMEGLARSMQRGIFGGVCGEKTAGLDELTVGPSVLGNAAEVRCWPALVLFPTQSKTPPVGRFYNRTDATKRRDVALQQGFGRYA